MSALTWRDRGRCKGADPTVFYPEDDEDPGEDAKEICETCIVREACLEYAIASPGEARRLGRVHRPRTPPSRSPAPPRVLTLHLRPGGADQVTVTAIDSTPSISNVYVTGRDAPPRRSCRSRSPTAVRGDQLHDRRAHLAVVEAGCARERDAEGRRSRAVGLCAVTDRVAVEPAASTSDAGAVQVRTSGPSGGGGGGRLALIAGPRWMIGAAVGAGAGGRTGAGTVVGAGPEAGGVKASWTGSVGGGRSTVAAADVVVGARDDDVVVGRAGAEVVPTGRWATTGRLSGEGIPSPAVETERRATTAAPTPAPSSATSAPTTTSVRRRAVRGEGVGAVTERSVGPARHLTVTATDSTPSMRRA